MILAELNKLTEKLRAYFGNRLVRPNIAMVVSPEDIRFFMPFVETDPLSIAMGTIVFKGEDFNLSADEAFLSIIRLAEATSIRLNQKVCL